MKIEQFGPLGMGDYLLLQEERAEKEGRDFDRAAFVEETIAEVQDPAYLFFMFYDGPAQGFMKVRLDQDLWVEDIYPIKSALGQDLEALVQSRLQEVQETWSLGQIHWPS